MPNLERHVYDKDIIVIGGTLEAFLYAYNNELPVIYIEKRVPFRFDKLKHENLRVLGANPDQNHRKSELWARLHFFLGLSGLLPMADNAASARVEDSQLSVITQHSRNVKFNFNKLVIFDDEKVSGLPRIKKETKGKNRVLDWVNVRSGCSHGVLHLHSDEDFVKEIIFYPTDRSDNRNLKDLVAISYLTDEEVNDFNFSDTMVKFKVTEMMKGAGIRGARNGRDVNNPERYKYYSVKVEPAQRVIESDARRYYQPDDRFEFNHDTTDQLVQQLSLPKGYLSKISEAF